MIAHSSPNKFSWYLSFQVWKQHSSFYQHTFCQKSDYGPTALLISNLYCTPMSFTNLQPYGNLFEEITKCSESHLCDGCSLTVCWYWMQCVNTASVWQSWSQDQLIVWIKCSNKHPCNSENYTQISLNASYETKPISYRHGKCGNFRQMLVHKLSLHGSAFV